MREAAHHVSLFFGNSLHHIQHCGFASTGITLNAYKPVIGAQDQFCRIQLAGIELGIDYPIPDQTALCRLDLCI